MLTYPYLEDQTSGNKTVEESKISDQLSQSTISGKPSPFIINEKEVHLFRDEPKPITIRNKSCDNISVSTVLLENRYRNSLKHSKIQSDYELYELMKEISAKMHQLSKESFSWNFLKEM